MSKFFINEGDCFALPNENGRIEQWVVVCKSYEKNRSAIFRLTNFPKDDQDVSVVSCSDAKIVNDKHIEKTHVSRQSLSDIYLNHLDEFIFLSKETPTEITDFANRVDLEPSIWGELTDAVKFLLTLVIFFIGILMLGWFLSLAV